MIMLVWVFFGNDRLILEGDLVRRTDCIAECPSRTCQVRAVLLTIDGILIDGKGHINARVPSSLSKAQKGIIPRNSVQSLCKQV